MSKLSTNTYGGIALIAVLLVAVCTYLGIVLEGAAFSIFMAVDLILCALFVYAVNKCMQRLEMRD